MKQNSELATARRTILWDESRDHYRPGVSEYRDTPAAFRELLAAALRSGQPFHVGYDGHRTPALFEWFCQLVWYALDGRVSTFLVVEELGRVTPHPGDATPWHGRLLTEGRKYGLHYHAADQRSQKISKTALESCKIWWVGPQMAGSIKRIADYTGIPDTELASLKPLEFCIYDEYSPAPFTRKRLTYQK